MGFEPNKSWNWVLINDSIISSILKNAYLLRKYVSTSQYDIIKGMVSLILDTSMSSWEDPITQVNILIYLLDLLQIIILRSWCIYTKRLRLNTTALEILLTELFWYNLLLFVQSDSDILIDYFMIRGWLSDTYSCAIHQYMGNCVRLSWIIIFGLWIFEY